ncbi:aminodeoxychorismate/anthranilate synthase component II [Lautropia dentalis]|uniref:Aminodeoxychorismate/anthranilate synthase component II n=1 Tax=Lautropia dentalis TaxID=2490857 RepID=A0A3R8LM86_9BURK|nr:aminodeoxychorismate/anthranilate synthase component II [Lautropia dentalis]RRN44229.1 aminodeoxychorismate/anthranilate synthase component II [Lautropia dentalis]
MPARILMIDNYDSFTYNIVQYLGELGADVTTIRSDAIDLDGIRSNNPSHLMFSPGPGDPDGAGVTLDAIRTFAGQIPMFGVCLGQQAIGQAFGGKVVRAKRVMHGKHDTVIHNGKGAFAGLPERFQIVRYHSLVIDPATVPDCLEVTAWTEDGEIMGLRHRELPIEGVQFHPESIESEHGHALFRNFLEQNQ